MDGYMDDIMTETWLGRHSDAFSILEERLQQHRHHEPYTYRALVIGAGLDTSTELWSIESKLPKKLRDLASSKFSFEPFEVAALLERLGTDYEVVVYDHSPTVLNRVRAQQQLPVGFLFDRQGDDVYIRRLAGTFPASVLEEAVAWRGKHNGGYAQETLVLLPTGGFLQRMSFVQGEAGDLGSVVGEFDVVTAFNTGLVTASSEVPSHVASRVNPGGFVCIGAYGPSIIRVPPGFEEVHSDHKSMAETGLDFPYAEAVFHKVA